MIFAWEKVLENTVIASMPLEHNNTLVIKKEYTNKFVSGRLKKTPDYYVYFLDCHHNRYLLNNYPLKSVPKAEQFVSDNWDRISKITKAAKNISYQLEQITWREEND